MHTTHSRCCLFTAFTHFFQIDGPKVTYLGTGDLHQAKYDYLGMHSTLLELNQFATRGSKYTGAMVDEIFCPFTLHVYPSDDMYNQFSTNNGIIFALSAVAIFAFTSCKSTLPYSLLFPLYSFLFSLLTPPFSGYCTPTYSGVCFVRCLRREAPKVGHEQSRALFGHRVVSVSFGRS